MSNQIEEYLITLKKELTGSDPAIIQDALSDAEEHLRTALSILRSTQSEISENDAIASVIDDFGTPEEIAAGYKEIEIRFPPAFSRPAAAQPSSFLGKFFGVITEARTWGALLYLILSLATGIIYFTWVTVGFSTSVGLLVLIIGLPVTGLFLLSIKGIALIEGRIVEALLGVPMPRRPIFMDKELNLWQKFKVLVSDSRTWLAMLYMVLQLPLGIIYFTLFVTLLSVSVSFIAAPILRWIFGPVTYLSGDGLITGFLLAAGDYLIPVIMIAGFLLFFATMHLAKLLGKLHGNMAKVMLVRN